MTGSVDQLKEELEAAQAGKQRVETQLAAGERVLTRTRDDKNKLQDSNTLLGEELKDVRAQLADAVKEIGVYEAAYSVAFELTSV